METLEKVKVLSDSARYDLCGSYLCSSLPRSRGGLGRWIYPAVLPNGKTVLLLKILLSNECSNDCLYCLNRAGRDFPRYSLQPEELSRLFMNLYRRRYVKGLFLSSAVEVSPNATMEKMIKTVEILRMREKFKGYIHLKILPGVSFSYVKRAVELSDRVSVNLEAPNKLRLEKISRAKDFEEDLLLRMKWVSELTSQGKLLPAGQTTQFVVGATKESDKEILRATFSLYQKINLRRAYFSAFQPVEGTPLEGHPATPLIREHRLYQVDFLFRHYGFKLEEIVFGKEGNLSRELDPKAVWAFNHPERFPLEINKADRDELLKVPGIGPKSATRIVRERIRGKFHSLEELKRIGIRIKRVAPFILINGRLLSSGDKQTQLPLG